MNVENDRKHCALQISREYFGACLPRHGASQTGGQRMRGITNVDTRQVAVPLLWLSGSAISPARLFK